MQFEDFLRVIQQEASNVNPADANKAIAEQKFYGKSHKEELKGRKQDRKERKVYANLTFTLISIWLTLILVTFIAIGQKRLEYSDSVIITLLTTTTVEVIGLFIIIAKYLFPSKN
jgi:hypothetical protein